MYSAWAIKKRNKTATIITVLTRQEWISIMTERFTDSNADQLKDRGVNIPHNWMIPWFITERFTDSDIDPVEQQKSESPS